MYTKIELSVFFDIRVRALPDKRTQIHFYLNDVKGSAA
jgi:hypothetical protein